MSAITPTTEIENYLMQAAGIMRNSINKDKALEEVNRAILYFLDIRRELQQPEFDLASIEEDTGIID